MKLSKDPISFITLNISVDARNDRISSISKFPTDIEITPEQLVDFGFLNEINKTFQNKIN